MALIKTCPKCHCVQHCRRRTCKTCEYVFRKPTGKKSRVVKQGSELREDKSEKVINAAIQESQVRKAFYRGCPLECVTVDELSMKGRQRKAEKRSRENVEEAGDARKSRNRQFQAEKRARQTNEQADERRECNREYMAKKRSSETDKQADERRACIRECMAKKRSSETDKQANERRVFIRECMAKKRSSESDKQADERRACIRECMAKKRSSETDKQADERKASNRQYMAMVRSNETVKAADKRKAKNRCFMSDSRSSVKPIDTIINEFLSKVCVGPEYICTSCHRMLYKHSVVTFRCTKYTKASPELLDLMSQLAHVTNGKQWICMSCDRSLCRGVLPVQSKANGMELDNQPPELSCLNALEQRLISLRVPFMKWLHCHVVNKDVSMVQQ